jgi:hypothetical protein
MRLSLPARNWRVTHGTIAAAASCLLAAMVAGEVTGAQRLIGQDAANRLGLTRAWFTQVRLDPARNQVERAVLRGDRLTVLTTAGVVQDINALTGQTFWTARIGNENYPSLGPAANDKYVALVNGSTLYVLDRKDGKPVVVRSVGGAPGAAPALAEKFVFVPLVTGRIEGITLADQKLRPWYYQSFGKAMVRPLVTPESILWTTDAGYLYVGNSNELGMRYRLETGSDIVAPPSYLNPLVIVASLSGDVFAMHELSGHQRWKYSTGFPVTRAAAGIGNRVFVTSGEPALHCIDANTGSGLWESPRMVEFAAVSKDRVYGVNEPGALVVLNAATGAVMGQVASGRPLSTLVNDQTDRVYLVSDEGVVECLHEVGATQPLYHTPQAEAKEKPAAEKPAAKPAVKPETPAAAPDVQPPAEETREETAPAKRAETPEDDNPFD